jgi:superfamily II RNA helicase
MAGRAGRRGKDTLGNVIIVPFKDFIDENQAIKIMISKPQKIISKLNLDFMFTINILNKNLNSITENSDKNFIINLIIDEYLKSFYCYQDKGYNKKILNIITNKINNDDIDKFNRIQELNIWLINNDNRISLSKKVKQNLENEKNILLMELGTKYTDILEYNISLNKFQQLTLQVELILKFLFEQSYIDTNYILTKSGKILNEISDCNPFILTELLDNDYLTLLDFNEICSVLSIFIIESKNDDYININSLDCSDDCKKLLYNITTICDSNIIKEKDIILCQI